MTLLIIIYFAFDFVSDDLPLILGFLPSPPLPLSSSSSWPCQAPPKRLAPTASVRIQYPVYVTTSAQSLVDGLLSSAPQNRLWITPCPEYPIPM
jgi:hypothetical protein